MGDLTVKSNQIIINNMIEKQKITDFDGLVEFLEDKFDGIGQKFSEIDDKINQLPTKSYLDDKIAGLEGGLITKLRKEDDKMNRLLEIMKQKNLLSESEVAELANLVVFPKET